MSKADNKELEEAIKALQKLKIEIDNIFYALHTSNPKKGKERNAIGLALKELKRLQEETIPKDKIKEKIEELKGKEENTYSKIKELENIVGMSLKEYEELNKLYNEYNEILIKIEILEELLGGK